MIFLTLSFLIFASLQSNSTYSISGTLRDSDGQPFPGVHVAAYTADLSNNPKPPGRSGLSDASGRFVINLAQPGKYVLIYNGEQSGHLPQYLPFFRDPNNPPPQVVLTESSPTAQVDVTMSKNGRLSGQAIDAQTELPIDNVNFLMCHADRGACWNVSAKSADGKFSIPTPFVPFTLVISSPQFENWLGLNGNERNHPVSVPAGANSSLTLLMKRRPETSAQTISEIEKNPGLNLPAPKQIAPENDQIFDFFPRATKLQWSPVDGAVSYSIELDFCDGKDKHNCVNPQPLRMSTLPPTTNITTTFYEFNFIGAQPGRWRVWAVDKEGREGFKSSWRTFVYLR